MNKGKLYTHVENPQVCTQLHRLTLVCRVQLKDTATETKANRALKHISMIFFRVLPIVLVGLNDFRLLFFVRVHQYFRWGFKGK